jgi:hypothetical protein
MRLFILFVLLTISQFTNAMTLSKHEKECMIRNVYHEARGLKKYHWIKVAKVLLARKKAYNQKIKFHAKSSNLCDLVKSREYKSHVKAPIKEKKVFKEITLTLQNVKEAGKNLYFASHGGRMYYH